MLADFTYKVIKGIKNRTNTINGHQHRGIRIFWPPFLFPHLPTPALIFPAELSQLVQEPAGRKEKFGTAGQRHFPFRASGGPFHETARGRLCKGSRSSLASSSPKGARRRRKALLPGRSRRAAGLAGFPDGSPAWRRGRKPWKGWTEPLWRS